MWKCQMAWTPSGHSRGSKGNRKKIDFLRNLKIGNTFKNPHTKKERPKNAEGKPYGNCKKPETTTNLWALKEKGKKPK